MSSIHTDVEAFADVEIPDDADPAAMAILGAAVGTVANRTAFLRRRRILAAGGFSGEAAFGPYSSAVFVAVDGSLVSLGTLEVGDIVMGSFTADMTATGDIAHMQAAVLDGPSYQRASRVFSVTSGTSREATHSIYYVVTTGGVSALVLQVATDSGMGSLDVSGDFFGNVLVVRP